MGKFRLATKIVCKENHWPALVQHGNLAIFLKQIFMCNLVGAKVVHRSDGDDVCHSSWATAARHGAQWLFMVVL